MMALMPMVARRLWARSPTVELVATLVQCFTVLLLALLQVLVTSCHALLDSATVTARMLLDARLP